MTLREAKQTVRQWVRTHFDDQRLAQVYAFNADGNMAFSNPCGCLLGVTLADHPHTHSDTCRPAILPQHYLYAKLTPGGQNAERAYSALAPSNELRRVRLSAILRAELRRRDRVHTSADTALQIEVPA